MRAIVIGGGPAGLIAAEQLSSAGIKTDIFDAMPSVARKFLLAGIGGMNITHSEPYADFVLRYREASDWLRPILDDFTPDMLRSWIHDLGVETFVGTSGRVFPKEMKAAPLLRAWKHRLTRAGVTFHPRHRWQGWNSKGELVIAGPDGELCLKAEATVFALGGASWSKLGSDGAWTKAFIQRDIAVNPLRPSNCGFTAHWSEFLQANHGGTPLKQVAISVTGADGTPFRRTGECIVSSYGLEGSLVYACSALLRDLLLQNKPGPHLHIDWLPNLNGEAVLSTLQAARKGETFSNLLRKKFRLPGITNALLRECLPDLDRTDKVAVTRALKNMPVTLTGTRPMDEAISCSGGIDREEVNGDLMLTKMPGVFVAGEMLDWEAPTGGYLLTACFATGKRAGMGAVRYLESL